MEDERVQVREKERETGIATRYDKALLERKKFIDLQMNGKVVIKGTEMDYELNRQGRIKRYLRPDLFPDNPLRDWVVFLHDIRIHSGRHVHQGGCVIIFVLEGHGYTIVDGVRHDWEEGDLLLLPIKPGGVEHQHFNLDLGKGCVWIAFYYRPWENALGSVLVQTGASPEYKGQ